MIVTYLWIFPILLICYLKVRNSLASGRKARRRVSLHNFHIIKVLGRGAFGKVIIGGVSLFKVIMWTGESFQSNYKRCGQGSLLKVIIRGVGRGAFSR